MDAGASRRQGVERHPLLTSILAFVLTAWLISVAEFARLPAQLLWSEPVNLFHGGAYVLRLMFTYCLIPVIYVSASALLQSAPVRHRARPRLRLIAAVAFALGVTGHAYYVLVQEEAFRILAFPPLFATGAAFLATAGFLAGGIGGGGWRRGIHFALPVLTMGAGLAIAALNYVVEPHAYPSFHHAAVLMATTFVGSGFVQMAGRGWLWLPRNRVLATALVALVGLPLFSASIPLSRDGLKIRRYVRARTALGQARLLAVADSEGSAKSRVRVVDEQGVERFAAHHGLPELPPGFVLENHNVLLVFIETLRWDSTSMGNTKRDLTPNLAQFVEDGAYLYSRAYAPSSGTLQSVSSIMSMRPPAATRIELSHTWKGRLRSSQTTAAEILLRAGWTTFAVLHNHRKVFTRRILGLTQGFADRELVLEESDDESARTLDARIVSETLRRMADPIASRSPFFGWVFFGGPHHPYVDYPDQGVAKSKRLRYYQEVRNTDQQLGNLLDALRDQGRLDDTIVIVAGDHGEEFGDHGNWLHAGTLYEEVVHVPLAIWIPGAQGSVVDQPVSLTYLLPWLLIRSGDQSVVRAARESLRNYLGPVLQATEGAVVTELVGKARHFSALVDGTDKIVYDHINEIFEGYDLAKDPREKIDLMLEGDPRFDSLVERFEAYRRVMDGYEQYEFVGPMPEDEDEDEDEDEEKDKGTPDGDDEAEATVTQPSRARKLMKAVEKTAPKVAPVETGDTGAVQEPPRGKPRKPRREGR